MTTQIFLITPMNAASDSFPALLANVLASAPVSALLVQRGEHDDASFSALVKAVLPIAQSNECAVLVDGDAPLAKKLGADGAHISSGINTFKEATALLKPDMIVGAGNIHSRHDAMTKGEAGADYMFFGPRSGSATEQDKLEAEWWAETMEVPGVFCDPETDPNAPETAGCEFIALSDSIWNAANGPATALATIANKLGASE